MKISYLKLAIKFLFGGREAVLDYVLDIANNCVAALSDANKEKVQAVVAALNRLLALCDRLLTWCPAKWRTQFLNVTLCIGCVANAAEDLEITKDELAEIADKFKIAYADWRTDDSTNLLGDLAQEDATVGAAVPCGPTNTEEAE